MTLQDWLPELRSKLGHISSDDISRDIRILAAHALCVEPSRMTLHMHDALSASVQAHISQMVELRAQQVPVSKIIGQRMFWGRNFVVNGDVLDPRGDTETLIAACLELGAQKRVLDLGTGSGAIGLTLAVEWPSCEVVCTDISDAALRVARENMHRLGVAKSAALVQSDWFESVQGKFDLIVSNPPYIALDEWGELDLDVRGFDPRIALTDEGDGLAAYRILTSEAGAFLRNGGRLMLEIGHKQGMAVSQLFEAAGFTALQCLPDMAGRDRVICGVWP